MPSVNRRNASLAAVVLAAVLATPTVHAQDFAPAAPNQASPELVYAASRYAQTLADAPASVTLINRDEIDAFGWRTLDEMLDSVVGFFATDDRSYTYITVRGLHTLGDYGSRILVMVNGHRVNTAIWEYGGWGIDGLLDVSTIERVEVIRGSGSSMYGTNALYAVVNIVTRTGGSVEGVEIEAAGGSFSTWDGSVIAGGRTEGADLDYVLGVSGMESDGPDLYFPEWDDPSTGDGRAVGLDWVENRRAFGQVRLGDLTFQGGWSNREQSIPTGSFSTVFGQPGTQTEDGRLFASASYERAFENLSRLWLSLDYNEAPYEGFWVYDYGRFRDYADERVWTLNGQYQFHVGDHSLTLGGDARSLDANLISNDVDPYSEYFNVSEVLDNRAVFGQGEFHLGDNVVVVAGLRYDWYETFGGTTNPRLAVVWKLAPGSSLKAMYNQAFRAPDPAELYYSDGSITWKPSEGLDPETTSSWELAFEHGFGPRLRGSATIYHMEVDELIGLTLDPTDELLVYRNLGGLESDGLELEISGHLVGPLTMRASYAYQDAVDSQTDDTPVGSPTHLGWLGLGAELLENLLSASIDVRYIGSRPDRFGTTEGDATLVGATLRCRPLDDRRLDLFATVDNLLDTDYGHVVGDDHVQRVVPMDGATYRVGLRWTFDTGR